MPVAKSFQKMTQLCEPYIVSGKQYVKVRNEATGTERQVRWYSDTEYAKLYPEDAPKTPPANTYAKQALGFSAGPITIFKGDIDGNQEWFEMSNARFCTLWGWYIVSTESLPSDIPDTLQTIPAEWEYIGNPDGSLKNSAAITRYINSLLYEESPSQHIGTIGQRLELQLKVTKVSKNNSKYGVTTSHYMEDSNGNVFLWATNAKSWQVGEVKKIRGSIKEFTTLKNVKITVLTRCSEV